MAETLNQKYFKVSGLTQVDVEKMAADAKAKPATHAEKVALTERVMHTIPGGVVATCSYFTDFKDSFNSYLFGSYTMLGDVTNSYTVTKTDVEKVKAKKGADTTVEANKKYDVNKDNVVDDKDVAITKMMAADVTEAPED